MSRFAYTALLFVMSAVGFGEARSAMAGTQPAPQSNEEQSNDAIGIRTARGWEDGQCGQTQMRTRPRSTAVAGVRG
jgi:hypothetical protein